MKYPKKTVTEAELVEQAAQYFGGGDAATERALPSEEIVEAWQQVQHVKVKVKKLPHYGDLPDLKQATLGSSGIDLFAALDEKICLNNMGARHLVPTGIALELPVGFEAQVRPRSGLAAKEGVTVLNTPGTIDSDYRGEIKVILINNSTKRFFVEPGMRIAQLVVKPVVVPVIEYVDELSMTDRGEGGFGSTGK